MELGILNLGRFRAALAVMSRNNTGPTATVRIEPNGTVIALGGVLPHSMLRAEDTVEPFTGKPIHITTGGAKLPKAATMAFLDLEAGVFYARLSETRTDESPITVVYDRFPPYQELLTPVAGSLGESTFDFRTLYDVATSLDTWPQNYFQVTAQTLEGGNMRFTFPGEEGLELFMAPVVL